jgi:hypothetical protein
MALFAELNNHDTVNAWRLPVKKEQKLNGFTAIYNSW